MPNHEVETVIVLHEASRSNIIIYIVGDGAERMSGKRRKGKTNL